MRYLYITEVDNDEEGDTYFPISNKQIYKTMRLHARKRIAMKTLICYILLHVSKVKQAMN